MRKEIIIGLICGIGLLLIVDVYAQEYVFGPNMRVNDDPPGMNFHGTPNAGQRGVAVRGDTVYCVWRDERAGNGIWFAKSIDDGETFLPNLQVDDGLGSAILPTLAVGDDGTIYAAWQDMRPGYSYWQVYFSKSTDVGLTFTPDVVVNDTAGGIKNHPHRNPSMAVDSAGTIYIAFDDARNGRYDIYFSKSTDGGMTFLPDVMVNDSLPWVSGYRTRPGLAVDDAENVYVVWKEESYHSWNDIYFSRSMDGGMTFLPDVAASDTDSCLFRMSPSINIDKWEYIHVVWRESDANANIFYSRCTDGGFTFGTNIRVNDSIHEAAPQTYPSMCVDDSGIVYAVWEDGREFVGLDRQIYFTYTTDNGDSVFFEPDVRVTNTDSACWVPSIAVGDSGKVYVQWMDFRNGAPDVYFSRGKYDSGIEEEQREEGIVRIFPASPNPFSNKTVIEFRNSGVESPTLVTLGVYDISGRLIRTLVNKPQGSGLHRIVWNGRNEENTMVPSGVYFVKGKMGKLEVNQKVIYIY